MFICGVCLSIYHNYVYIMCGIYVVCVLMRACMCVFGVNMCNVYERWLCRCMCMFSVSHTAKFSLQSTSLHWRLLCLACGLWTKYLPIAEKGRKEGNISFSDALNTFYLWLYGVRHKVSNKR